MRHALSHGASYRLAVLARSGVDKLQRPSGAQRLEDLLDVLGFDFDLPSNERLEHGMTGHAWEEVFVRIECLLFDVQRFSQRILKSDRSAAE